MVIGTCIQQSKRKTMTCEIGNIYWESGQRNVIYYYDDAICLHASASYSIPPRFHIQREQDRRDDEIEEIFEIVNRALMINIGT